MIKKGELCIKRVEVTLLSSLFPFVSKEKEILALKIQNQPPRPINPIHTAI